MGDASIFDHLASLINPWLEQEQIPGLAVAFFDRSRVVQVVGYGFANREARTPMTPATLLAIGSITKSFTAVAVLLAAERGLLDLDRPVTDYLPWFVVQSRYQPITLHHLLTHTAGLIGVIDRSPDIRGAVWALRETETAWAPGSRFAYSDASYQTLTLVLEAVTGQPFAQIVRDWIFRPLHMHASQAALTHATRPRLATGYVSLYDDRPHHAGHPLVPAPWIETSSGDCCIATTMGDLARFGRMILNAGVGQDGALLAATSYAQLSQLHSHADGFDYGYGLMQWHIDGATLLGHGGSMPGYAAELIVDVNNGLGIAVASNAAHARSLFRPLLRWWRAAALGQPFDRAELRPQNRLAIANAADYAGDYANGTGRLTITVCDAGLAVEVDGQQIRLEQRGSQRFLVPAAPFDHFFLQFKHEAPTGGHNAHSMVAVWHSGDRYGRVGTPAPPPVDHPPTWDTYVGHYRAHNPWQTNFRVILRNGLLVLVWPSGDEEPLFPRAVNTFDVGEVGTPQRLHFDQIAAGQTLRATLATCDYYRFFTP